MLRAKALTGLLVETTTSLGVVFLLGHHCWHYNPVAWGSFGENTVQIMDERRRRLWRCSLLEGVISKESSRFRYRWSTDHGHTQPVVAIPLHWKLNWCAELVWRCSRSWWQLGLLHGCRF